MSGPIDPDSGDPQQLRVWGISFEGCILPSQQLGEGPKLHSLRDLPLKRILGKRDIDRRFSQLNFDPGLMLCKFDSNPVRNFAGSGLFRDDADLRLLDEISKLRNFSGVGSIVHGDKKEKFPISVESVKQIHRQWKGMVSIDP